MAEYFDVCDERGQPLGIVKERSLVHRDGDWHRVFHCWVVDPKGPSIVLQQRAATKEVAPGLWDVSVGGHYSAGEGIEGGLREIEEELGLKVKRAELIHVGWQRWVNAFPNGIIEREIADIFFLCRPIRLGALHPALDEISALTLVPARVLERVAEGKLPTAPIRARHAVSGEGFSASLTLDSLVPRGGERDYYGKAARFAEALAKDEARVHRRRWW